MADKAQIDTRKQQRTTKTGKRRKRRRQLQTETSTMSSGELGEEGDIRLLGLAASWPRVLLAALLLIALVFGSASTASPSQVGENSPPEEKTRVLGNSSLSSSLVGIETRNNSRQDSVSSSESPLVSMRTSTASSFESLAPDESDNAIAAAALATTAPTSGETPTSAPDASGLDEQDAYKNSGTLEGASVAPEAASTEPPPVDENRSRSNPSTGQPSVALQQPDTSEPSAGSQLVRSRKSPDRNCTDERPAPNATSSESGSGPSQPASQLPKETSKQQASTSTETSLAPVGPPFSGSTDYEDFDLDYQLNLSSPAAPAAPSGEPGPTQAANEALNLNKRDQDERGGARAPAWLSLLKQAHVFGAAANSSSSLPLFSAGSSAVSRFNTAPPMPPTLLTVQSNQLTSQELGRLAPQLLLYQDNYDMAGQSGALEVNRAAVNGDLIATASGGGGVAGLPAAGPLLTLDGASSTRAKRPPPAPELQGTISLHNGSPVIRQKALTLFAELPRRDNQSVGVSSGGQQKAVDSGAQLSITRPDGESSSITPAPGKGGPSQTNHWLNYPDPALHQNPLLLHHILNKPALYAQHLSTSQQLAEAQTTSGTSMTTTTTQSPFARSSQEPEIIERPTLIADSDQAAKPVNQTQLQMQLEEMRAIASHQAKQQPPASRRPPSSGGDPPSSTYLAGLFAERARAQTSHSPSASDSTAIGSRPAAASSTTTSGQPPTESGSVNSQLQLQSELLDSKAAAPTDLFGVLKLKSTQDLSLGRQRQQQQLKSVLASQLIEAPALPQEISAPQPTAKTTAGKLDSIGANYSPATLIRQLAALGEQQPAAASSIRDEQMSTYVAQLASLGVAHSASAQSAATEQQPSSTSGWNPWQVSRDGESGGSIGDGNATITLIDGSPIGAGLRAAPLMQHMEAQPSKAPSEADMETLVRKLVEAQIQPQQPESQQQPANLAEFLRQVKLIGLPAEVQAQLYREHLAPLLRPPAGPPYSTSGLPMESTNQQSSHAPPTPADSGPAAYASLDGHQRQQKKEREQLRQLAFIEALRASAARMQAAGAFASRKQSYLNATTATASTEPPMILEEPEEQTGDARPAAVIGQQAASVAGAEQSWSPERQVQQESLIHETAHVHPLGHSERTTFIGRSPQAHGPAAALGLRQGAPSSVFQLPGPPRGLLRPLASIAQLQPSPPFASVQRPLFPLAADLSAWPPAVGGGSFGALPAPLTAGSLLADRLPLSSAPAYLVRLPSLAGGSFAAAGALIPPQPPRLFRHRQPVGALRLLGAAGSQLMVPARIRLGQSPVAWRSPHLSQSSAFRPVFAPPQLGDSYAIQQWPAAARPSPLSIRANLSPQSPVVGEPATGALLQPQPSSWDTRTGQATTVSSAPVSADSTPLQALSSSVSSGQSAPAAMLLHPAQQQPQAAHTFAGQPAPMFATSPLANQNSAAAALSRLQQATASLVELTSLASLVEEMVSGHDIGPSPAAALASAISQLSAAQSAALTAQAAGQQSSSSGDINSDLQTPPSVGGRAQTPAFSWRSLLNPSLWRDKPLGGKMRDFSALERLVGATNVRRPPASRLRVKYIRVPVAVYESSGDLVGGGGSNGALGKQLITKAQLAEIVATGGQQQQPAGTSDGSSLLPHGTSSSSASSGSSPSSQPQASSSSAGAGSSSVSVANSAQIGAAGNALGSSAANPAAAATSSSNEILFDELSSGSAPQFALALRDLAQHQHQQQLLVSTAAEENDALRVEYLPMITSVGRPTRKLVYPVPLGALNPLESARYHSLLAAPGVATAAGGPGEPSEPEPDPSRGKKAKKQEQEEEPAGNQEDDEEDDDDDLLSGSDLPLLESIISALVQGPAHPAAPYAHAPYPPPHSSPGWGRFRPFSGLRQEASSNYETYAHPLGSAPVAYHLSPFGKQGRRFSLGEVVGALGARKLLTSLLSRRKGSRTSKRATGGAQKAAAWPPVKPPPTAATAASGTVGHLPSAKHALVRDKPTSAPMAQAMKVKYPSIAAYEQSATKGPGNAKPTKGRQPTGANEKRKTVIKGASSGKSRNGATASARAASTTSTTSSPSTRKTSSSANKDPIQLLLTTPPARTAADGLQFSFISGPGGRGSRSGAGPRALVGGGAPARRATVAMPAYQLLVEHLGEAEDQQLASN